MSQDSKHGAEAVAENLHIETQPRGRERENSQRMALDF